MLSSHDRTLEWQKILVSLSSDANTPSKLSNNSGKILQRSQFTEAAKNLNESVYRTLCKLEKLTLLAKKQTLFEDQSGDVQELSYIIKQDLSELSKMILQLQSFSTQHVHNTPYGQERQHSENVIRSFGFCLTNMRNDFERLLKVHWNRLKVQEDRKGILSGNSKTSTASSGHFPVNASNECMTNEGKPSVPSRLIEDEVRAKAVTHDDSSARDNYRIDLTQQLMMVDDASSYYNSRVKAMGSIESTIHELGRIMSQIANIVQEQEQSVARIDVAVENTESNVQAAHSELLRYFQSVSSNRWLMIKVIGVLVVFFVLFVVLFA